MISPERPSAVPGQVPVASGEALNEPAGPLLDAKGHEANRWAQQVAKLSEDAPVALASTLRRRAGAVHDESTLRATLGELGYDDQVVDRAARRARGGLRHPRFLRTAWLTFLAAGLAAAQQITSVAQGSGFTWAAEDAIEERFERHVRGAGERGVNRATAACVWHALCRDADQDGYCWPGIERIAKKGKVSERSVQRTIEIFEELGMLLVFPRHMDREGEPRSHLYLLLPAGVDETPDGRAPHAAPPSPDATAPPATSSPSPPSSPSPSRLPPAPRARELIVPQGRDAVVAAIRAAAELAPLDNTADIDALARAARRMGKEHLARKAFAELASNLRDGKYERVSRPLAIAFLRDVLAPGESDEERLAAENADLPPARVCRQLLGAVADRAEEDAAAKDVVPPPAPDLRMTREESAALLAALEGRAEKVDAAESRPP